MNRTAIFLVVAAGICFGCGRTNKVSVNGTGTQDGGTKARSAAQHASASPEETPAHPKHAAVVASSEIDASPGPVLNVTEADETQHSHPMPNAQLPNKTARLMLLAHDGPLLIDLHVSHGGSGVRAQFEQTLDQILAIAQADSDEPLTWQTLLNHPRFLAGQFGNPATGNYQSQQTAIQRYDTTTNGRVDRNELVRYLTNDRTSRPISFVSSNDRRTASRESSALATWLDQNRNRRLDASELASASKRLNLRDTDDDSILTANELVNLGDANDLQAMRARRRTSLAPKTGWIFEVDRPLQKASDIRIAWETLYAASQPIRREDLPRNPRIFDELDLDEDGTLDNIEMEMLTEIVPDWAVHVDFTDGQPRVALLASRWAPQEIQALIQHQENRITLRLPGLCLDLFARGDSSLDAQNRKRQAEAFLAAGDSDKDGMLTATEYGSSGALLQDLGFEAFDLDSDQLLSMDELTTVLNDRTLLNGKLLQIRADSQQDALFSTIDENADGRLDTREITKSGTALAQLDLNGDSELRTHEFPTVLMVGVALGGNTDTEIAPPRVQRVPSKSTPDWFAGMDRNRDQTISWREFVGDREQFSYLDQDADGFVDVAEATAYKNAEL